MSVAHKRQRTPSQSSSASSNNEHSSKVTRVTPEAGNNSNHASPPLLCSLPPTCNQRPTPIANTKDLEAHYAKYHAHVCEEKRCGCVFPDARLLELHQTECHDSLAAVRKERGEKIFACHLPTCARLFMTPKARRLHLIQAHGYPKEYFFAVTNKGVGGLLKRWGEGASMVRNEWKPREDKGKGKESDVNKMDVRGDEENSDESSEEEEERDPVVVEEDEAEEQPTPRVQPRRNPDNTDDANVDSLAGSMSSLALVPPSIRFGRGGVKGGFGHHTELHTASGRGSRGRGGVHHTVTANAMHVDRSSDAQAIQLPPAQGETTTPGANTNATGHANSGGGGRGYAHNGFAGRGGIHPPRGFRGRGRMAPGVFPNRGRGRGAPRGGVNNEGRPSRGV